VISLVLISFASCKKDELPFCEEFPDECAEITGVKDYFCFKEGSWWVYEEETSGERDSVYVTNQLNDPNSYYFRTETYSSHNQYEFNYWSFGGVKDAGMINKADNSLLIKISKTNPGDFVAESYCFIYYPSKGDRVASYGGYPANYNNQLVVKEFVSTMSVESDTFINVVNMTEEHTASENNQPTSKFYAESVGMIRKELLDSNEVWNLVDYNIQP
jgi:hypothetical protein